MALANTCNICLRYIRARTPRAAYRLIVLTYADAAARRLSTVHRFLVQDHSQVINRTVTSLTTLSSGLIHQDGSGGGGGGHLSGALR